MTEKYLDSIYTEIDESSCSDKGLSLKIAKINNEGLVVLRFNRTVLKIYNLTVIDETVF